MVHWLPFDKNLSVNTYSVGYTKNLGYIWSAVYTYIVFRFKSKWYLSKTFSLRNTLLKSKIYCNPSSPRYWIRKNSAYQVGFCVIFWGEICSTIEWPVSHEFKTQFLIAWSFSCKFCSKHKFSTSDIQNTKIWHSTFCQFLNIIAEVFYNVKNRLSFITSKSLSKNLSNENKHTLCFQRIGIHVLSWRQQKHQCLFSLLRLFDKHFDVIIDVILY